LVTHNLSTLRPLRNAIPGMFRAVSDIPRVVTFRRQHRRLTIIFGLALLPLCVSAKEGASRREEAVASRSRDAISSELEELEEVVFVPIVPDASVKLETTIFRPKGQGPFPLVVMNHGKAFTAPSKQARARFPVLSREFLKRGYAVVLPMRQGFSRSGGSYSEAGCDLEANGLAQAKDVDAIVGYFQKQSWVKADQILVMGQSHGGLVTMAYATRARPGVKLVVNFAGGLRSNSGRCKGEWQDQMVSAFRAYGARAQLPSLWFYGQNDRFFEPQLVQRMHAAYVAAAKSPKTDAKLVAFRPFGQDSHGMVEYSGGVSLWKPELERELKRLGLP
jgi:dienelactone hydrolase